ncbi:MAG: glycosyltransferase [Flavobacteriales bacterium]|nr:MAG: glycosyltransferase [Flavobacteriales bacterium]
MKVLFVINSSNNGGAPKMIVTLYREMKKQFPESKIVFLKKVISQYSDVEDAYYLTDNLSSPFEYWSAYNQLYNIVKTEKPDAIISFLPLSNILSSIIGKKLGVKIRIASQRNPPQIYGKVVRLLDKYLGSRAYYTSNVCNSQAGLEAFDEYPSSYKNHLSVINNCVEPADFSMTSLEAKRQLGVVQGKVVLTCVGRLHEQKNHRLLVKTMKHLDNAILYCAGGGPLYHEIKELIKSEGVQDKITLLGDLEREEVRSLLRATDIFVIPSLYEGLSNSLIEAMSYGLPIVFSDIPSFTNFLSLEKPGEYAGVLVRGNDEKEWAMAIDKIIKDQDLLRYYQKLSSDHVADLSAGKMTSRFIELLFK